MARQGGFTLLEVSVAIILVAIFSIAVFFAIAPAKRIGETNNATRVQDSKAVEVAIKSFLVDSLTSSTTISDIAADTYYALVVDGGSVSGTYTCSQLGQDINKKDIASELKPYIDSMPIDPDISSGDDTGYYFIRKGNLFNVGYCDWYDPNAVVAVGNQSPTISNAGRSPADGSINFSLFGSFSWTAWTDPDGDTVEYQTNFYNGGTCSTLYEASTWSTATSFNPAEFMSFLTLYSWQTRARSQGESDETAYNDCYSFTTEGLEF